jgi:hypothetical protein
MNPRHAPGRLAVDLMDGACRPQLHSYNHIINLKAMDSPKATYDRRRKSETMSPNLIDDQTFFRLWCIVAEQKIIRAIQF